MQPLHRLVLAFVGLWLARPSSGTVAESGRELTELRAEVARHDELYFRLGAPEISDEAYDRLKVRLLELEKRHPERAREPSRPDARGDDRTGILATERHRQPMLSLDKAHQEAELRSFHARMASASEGTSPEFVVEPKYDGLAVSLTYERGLLVRALTRGNGVEGDDITANVRQLPGVPDQLAGAVPPDLLEVRGEIYVPFAAFARTNAARERQGLPLYASPRHLAAGTIRQREPGEVAARGLRLVCFGAGACVPLATLPDSQRALGQRYREWGLPVIEDFWTARTAEELVAAVAACGRARGVLAFPLDGAVIKVDSRELQSRLGNSETAPRWALAYKFSPERVETKLLAITLQVGRTGALTPVAELEPVHLGGTVVARATLHNRAEIARRDLRVGDSVYVERAGDVIPAVVGVNLGRRPRDAEPFQFPPECPECREPLETEADDTIVRCGNAGCPGQVRRRVEHYASRNCVGIEGLGPAVIERLVSSGLVRDFPDIYRVRRHHLQALGGMGDKSVDRLLAAIERSKRVELWRVIHGLGLPQVGAAAARALAREHGDLEALAEAEPRCREVVEELLALGVRPREAATGAGGPLAGKTVVLTGTLAAMTRAEATERIERAGGRVAAVLSGGADLLVAGRKPGAKLAQARDLRVRIIDETELLQLLGGGSG